MEFVIKSKLRWIISLVFLITCVYVQNDGYAQQRKIRFLVTADPQYENGKKDKNALSSNTLKKMARPEEDIYYKVKGIIVAGDLTQNARLYDEFGAYTKSLGKDNLKFTYDGIGNHDLTNPTTVQKFTCATSILWSDTWCVSPEEIKNELKNRKRETTPSATSGIHYAWKWDDITFVHLNLFPGDSPGPNNLSPEKSLNFLNTVIKGMDKQRDRLIIIHHYGFDNFSTKGEWWSEDQREKYWDAIASVKVVGIFTGHWHRKSDENPENDFYRPASRTTGPDKIPAFTAGAASLGAYLDVTIDDQFMVVSPKHSDGHPTMNSISVPVP